MKCEFEKSMIHLNANMDKLDADKALIKATAKVLFDFYGFDDCWQEFEDDSEYFITISAPKYHTIKEMRDDYREAKKVAIEIVKQESEGIKAEVIYMPVLTKEELATTDLTREELHGASICGFLVGSFTYSSFCASGNGNKVLIVKDVLSNHKPILMKLEICREEVELSESDNEKIEEIDSELSKLCIFDDQKLIYKLSKKRASLIESSLKKSAVIEQQERINKKRREISSAFGVVRI